MAFIQIIDYETDQPAEIDARMREQMQLMGEPMYTRLDQTQDQDNPRHFMTIVEFPSYEVAMENNNRPEIDQMARELSAMCTSGPSYKNLDVQLHLP